MTTALRGVQKRATAPVGRARLEGPFWWQARGPVNVGARRHKTKIDAMRAFAADPINARTLEEFALYADPSSRARLYRACSGEFDAVNQRYDLTGARKVCSIDDALWHLTPKRGREGFFVEDIDLQTLNAIADAAQTAGRFRMPEPIAEARALDLEAAHTAELVDEHARERRRARRAPMVETPGTDLEAAEATHGAGWPLTHLDCEDNDGHLVPCTDSRSTGAPVRAVYRPSDHGRRTRVYLDVDDPSLRAATEDRAHRLPIRRGEAGDFPFGGGRAEGGDVMPGTRYVVGENGPEYFIPDAPGRIVPTSAQPLSTGTKLLIGFAAGAVLVGATVAICRWARRRRRA